MRGKKFSEAMMSSPATYSIMVKGKLSPDWTEWFNGTLMSYEKLNLEGLLTCLTCRVRDQAELLGILKQLNALNLPLMEVALITSSIRNSEERSTES
jgi:hypothetical protein